MPEADGPEPTESTSRIGVLLLSAFGLGLSPILPGTVASLATAVMLWGVGRNGGFVFVVGCAAFAVAASRVTLRYGHVATGEDGRGDPGWVVSDEVAGQAIACLGALPWCGNWRTIGAAFVLFRIFDMLKPPPVSTLEKLHGAKGILYDDIAAGVMAGIVTLVLGLTGLLPV